ncbi:MAG: flagellar filament outer layer protein FlaA [Spirochaetaceae bacterium]|nr:flagellar filament outer layer protein FlaA [Spirochaetaceae bacterium]
MKRYTYISTVLFLAVAAFLSAQEVGTPEADRIQGNADNEELKEVSVEKFEIDGTWSASLSADAGFVTSRLFPGGPSDKTPVPEEEGLDIPDTKVFGARVDFLRRGDTSIFLYPQWPIPIEGITKTVSVWVAGRNYNHTLVLLIQDAMGRYFELEVGQLNFQGWKKLTVAIPPQPDYGRQGIVQRDLHFTSLAGGIRIAGFRIDVDPMEAYGTYFIYLDDLRATTDLFAETSREPDDPNDDW